MGKATGFLEYKRAGGRELPVGERLRHFGSFTLLPDDETLNRQGARCMDCGVPFCHSSFGCPLGNLIPEWNDFVYRNQWQEAYERLEITNNFPEFTGHLCPAPCETACTLSINDSPVTIKQLELAIIERAFREGWVVPRPPDRLSGKSVAVIGSGPAGLAAAQQLRRNGHGVTVFERSAKIGGLLRYGIPDFKLEKHILDRRLQQMAAEGVVFKTDAAIGEDLSMRYLRKTFDVILIATGAGRPRALEVPGADLRGVHFAMEYLSRANCLVSGETDDRQPINAGGKNVLVIGGGDTGSDCVGTANRQGAKKVYQFEILPKPGEWRHSHNPQWPHRPHILRTTSSHREGCEREWAVMTRELRGVGGRLTEGFFQRVQWKVENNRPRMQPVPGTEFSLKLDLVLLAMGFLHVEQTPFLRESGILFDEKGNIKTTGNYMTSTPGIFVAGDAHSGPSLIVRAIHHGRQAAEAIDDWLKK